MRILYLTNNADRASTTVPTIGWFRYLMPRGLRPVLVSPLAGAFFDWARSLGVPSYQLDLPFPSKRWPVPFLRSLWRLCGIVKEHRIDLIHCNEQDVYPIGQYLGRWCRVPVVVSAQFTLEPGFSRWAFRGKRRPHRILFTSRGNREACLPGVKGLVPETAWRVLYNGVDLDRYRPSQDLREAWRDRLGLNGAVAIGAACALRPRKQLEHVFEAADRPDVRVVIAGGAVAGDEAYAARLLEDGRRKLGGRLLTVGNLTDLRGFYNALDLYVNTSQEEGCSLSIAECLGSGCPVVGYPSTSVHEQVLPSGGEIVEQDRVDLLTEALGRWVGDRRTLAAARDGARRRAEEAFDVCKLADQLWGEYQAVLNGGG